MSKGKQSVRAVRDWRTADALSRRADPRRRRDPRGASLQPRCPAKIIASPSAIIPSRMKGIHAERLEEEQPVGAAAKLARAAGVA